VKYVSRNSKCSQASGRLAIEELETRQLFSVAGLDTSFGQNGKAILRFNEAGNGDFKPFEQGYTIATDRQGRILVAGQVQSSANNYATLAVGRLNDNGTFDSSFGTNGKVVLDLPNTESTTSISASYADMKIDSLGRVVISGQIFAAEGQYNTRSFIAVTRLTADGELDSSFGTEGWGTTDFGSASSHALLGAMAIDEEGRILLAGSVNRQLAINGVDFDFAVARLTASGAIDTSFSGDGLAAFDFNIGGSRSDHGFAITTDRKGRIIVAGTVDVAAGNTDFGVVRLLEDGFLDPSFHGDGRATVSIDRLGQNKGHDEAYDVAVDKRGRIILAGCTQASEFDVDFAVTRLTSSGNLDNRFGKHGTSVIAFNQGGQNRDGRRNPPGQNVQFGMREMRVTLARDSRNRIVLCGPVQRGQRDFDFGVCRLTPRGRIDNGFGFGGRMMTGFNVGISEADVPWDVTTDRFNRILVVGGIDGNTALSSSSIGVVRFGAPVPNSNNSRLMAQAISASSASKTDLADQTSKQGHPASQQARVRPLFRLWSSLRANMGRS
jgi:uncharacterized delta-60 repeat protein